MKYNFKKTMTFENRVDLFNRISKNYKDLIPIIIKVHKNSKILLIKEQWLVPLDYTISDFINEIRKQTTLCYSDIIYIFNDFDKNLIPTNLIIQDLYDKHKDTDGFLYLVISLENNIQHLNTFSILDTILNSSKKFVKLFGY